MLVQNQIYALNYQSQYFRVAQNKSVLNDNCDTCTCNPNGETSCIPLICSPCKEGSYTYKTPDCKCVCKQCTPGSKLCKTSQTCILESQWCDGVEHCPDDEINCDHEEGKPNLSC